MILKLKWLPLATAEASKQQQDTPALKDREEETLKGTKYFQKRNSTWTSQNCQQKYAETTSLLLP